MTTTKAIRGIMEGEWAEIKAMASRERLPIGKYIVKMKNDAKARDNRKNWERILSFRIDPKKADEIEAAIKEFRKGFELREFK